MRATQTLYASRDRKHVVEEGDTDAAIQLVRAGSEIRDSDIKALGGQELVDAVYAAVRGGGRKAVAGPPENKALTPGETKTPSMALTKEELLTLAGELNVDISGPNATKAEILEAIEKASSVSGQGKAEGE